LNAIIKLSSPPTREFWEIPVLFEDEQLLAISKPSGLLASPDRHDPGQPNLMNLLHGAIAQGKPWAKERSLSYLMNAHRVDPESSGVFLLAKTKPMLVAMANLFGAEAFVMTYVALVRSFPREDAFEVDAPLGAHAVRPGVMRVDRLNGKKAKTTFEVAERFEGYTLLRCRPTTIRPYQIRVHLQSERLPVAGDTVYGGQPLWLSRLKPDYRLKPGKEERPLISKAALHAERLEFTHPLSGQPIVVTAPWPKDLTVAVKYLRIYAPAARTLPPGEAGQWGA